jgi:hypothetical protein
MGSDRHARQSFLGPESERILGGCTVGIVGLGGGGSHVAQQLVHVGVRHFVLYDPDAVEDTNLNRLVGGTAADAVLAVPKVHALGRLILGVAPEARVDPFPKRWQDAPEPLRGCDVILGCVDTFQQRHELEVCARRFLIPYIDIGLDVVAADREPPRMGGQVFLSMPGYPCLWCAGFLTDERLAREAEKYGDTGGRPQVVWANGVLASSAVGILVDLLTNWTRSQCGTVFLSYDANLGTVTPHPRRPYLPAACEHYPPRSVGTPTLRKI